MMASAQSTTVFVSHTGSANPVSGGWAWSSVGATTAAVPNEGAWNVDTSTAASTSYGYYTKTYTDVNDDLSQGWKLSAKIRVADHGDTLDGGIHTQFRTGSRVYSMWFGSDASGNPQVAVVTNLNGTTGPIHTTSGKVDQYVLYELIDEDGTAGSNPATLFVDGVAAINGSAGISLSTQKNVLFGDGMGAATQNGDGNYNLVHLEAGAGITPTLPSPPVAPTGLMALPVDHQRIDLSWMDNSTNETVFKIERKPDTGSFAQIATVSADTIAYSDTELSSTTTYTYRVRTTASTGNSQYSNETSASTPNLGSLGLPSYEPIEYTRTTVEFAYADTTTTNTDYVYVVDRSKRQLTENYDTVTSQWVRAREAKYYFDGTEGSPLAFGEVDQGNSTKVEQWVGEALGLEVWAVHTNGFDLYGNVIWTKDANANAGGKTNANEHTSDTTYEPIYQSKPVSVTNALGHFEPTLYDDWLRPTAITDANGQTTTTEYDVFSRIVKITRPLESVYPSIETVYSFDGIAPEYTFTKTLEQHGQPDTVDTYVFVDGFGRPIQSKQEDAVANQWVVTDTYYDDMGRKQAVSVPYISNDHLAARNALQKQTIFEYDVLDRMTKVTRTDGTETITAFDRQIRTTTDARGNKRRIESEGFGRILKIEELDATSTVLTATLYEHDKATGNLMGITDPQGKDYTFAFDGLGNRLSHNDSDLGEWVYTYDANGNQITRTDAKGQTTVNDYDALNRLIKVTSSDNEEVAFTYDTPTFPTIGFHNVGRLVGVEGKAGSPLAEVFKRTYGYDERGRRTSETFEMDGRSWTMATGYDAADREIAITYPGPPSETITLAYDSRGMLKSIAGTDAYLKHATYTPHGKIDTFEYANPTVTTIDYTYYDNSTIPNAYSYRLRGIEVTGGTVALNLQYAYDSVGNVTSLGDLNDSTKSQMFTYDAHDRLDTASGVYGSKDYEYDGVGNITSMDGGTTNYSYTLGSNRLADDGIHSVYNHDANGNIVSRSGTGASETYTYNGLNRLTDFTNGTLTESYTYGEGEERIKKESGGQTKYYVNRYLQQVESSSGTEVIRHYFAGDQRIATRDDDGLRYRYSDHLGSASRMADANGTQNKGLWYAPYGSEHTPSTTGSATVKFKFTDKEEDETGLYYYVARYYDSEVGRFMSADNILPDPYDPQQLNRYAYVRNNPVKLVDPDGHAAELAIFIASLTIDFIDDVVNQRHGPGSQPDGWKSNFGANPRYNDAKKNPEATLGNAWKENQDLVDGVKNVLGAAGVVKGFHSIGKNVWEKGVSKGVRDSWDTFAGGAIQETYDRTVLGKTASNPNVPNSYDPNNPMTPKNNPYGFESQEGFDGWGVVVDSEGKIVGHKAYMSNNYQDAHARGAGGGGQDEQKEEEEEESNSDDDDDDDDVGEDGGEE